MMGSPIVAETIAREGFSVVVLDAQHGLWDTASIITGIGAVSRGAAPRFSRIPLNDLALVSRALDFGAEAIIAPMINDADDARRFAAAAKYPPSGESSWGPPRIENRLHPGGPAGPRCARWRCRRRAPRRRITCAKRTRAR